MVSFLTEIPAFYNMPFPLDYPVIAPLYTDVDTRAGGTVFYRCTPQDICFRQIRIEKYIKILFKNILCYITKLI